MNTRLSLPSLRACALALALSGSLAAQAQPGFQGTAALHADDAPPNAGLQAAPDDSLFVALGGKPGIARLVDEFVPRLVADEHLNEFFKHARQDTFRPHLAQMICVLAGGDCVYEGASPAATHHDMDISRTDFNAVVRVLQDAMDAQHIPFATQNRLLAKLAPLHRDIVTTH